jgi:hypothetical protein
MNVSMLRTIDETEAKKIALGYVKKKESGAQAEIKSVERQDVWGLEISLAMWTKKNKGHPIPQCNRLGDRGS